MLKRYNIDYFSSIKLVKHIKLLKIPKKEGFMINLEVKAHKLGVVMIFLICFLVGEVVEEGPRSKCLKLNPLKNQSIFPSKIFIMVKCFDLLIPVLGAVKPVKVKAVKMSRSVRHAKDKVELFKCIKWGQVCISRFKKIVINVQDKDK